MSNERLQKAHYGEWPSFVSHIALVVIKGVFGYISGSMALIADAVHTAAEAAGSIALSKETGSGDISADKEHVNKQGKTEVGTAIIASVMLLLVGLELALSSVKTLYYGVDSSPEPIALIAIAASLVLKEAFLQYKHRFGKLRSFQMPVSHVWGLRSDVFSSLVAFAGAGGAMLGHYLGNKYLYYLDPIAGLLIAVMVFRMGYRVVIQITNNTAERVLHEEYAEELVGAVQSVQGVIAVDDLRAKEHGHYVIVDVKICVNPRISVFEGHDIAKKVKYTLMKRFIHISEVYIHVNPYDPGYPYKNIDADQDQFPSVVH
ncbi:cation diffusion facilitator family transporter [Paenibacillus sp. UNC451MF]|uniref:cation diffusion facilitator family transporter n=1 Tax=Paenibacillus sp. UNC451MF TaxID=1449063 RepID=UPI00048C2583|nr:cation diffusion facilitator family transporter [Paenibacillus sp. UNC451MF]